MTFFFLFVITGLSIDKIICHVCILEKSPDPKNRNSVKWWIPLKDVCFCQKLVTVAKHRVVLNNAQIYCSLEEPAIPLIKWWLPGNSSIREKVYRTPQQIDEVLNRIEICSKYICIPYIAFKKNFTASRKFLCKCHC